MSFFIAHGRAHGQGYGAQAVRGKEPCTIWSSGAEPSSMGPARRRLSPMSPTAWHGVTSVVIGNCSVGFAPLRPDDRGFSLRVMEAIEEIPVAVMEDGIEWDWESFPEFLDSLGRRRHTIDIAAQVTHVALRAYVMGERAEANEPASEAELAEMGRLAEEALRAGAIGISASRTKAHRYAGGGIVPGTYGNEHELIGLADALGRVGGGHVMQYLGNPFDLDTCRGPSGWSGCAIRS
jgi:N-acyl-D-aspartate/D-glutamate deacylase